MLSNFSIENSFYYIEQHHIEKYKRLIKQYPQYDYLIEESALSKNDCWVIAFYIWLLLLPKNNNIVENVKISMYYRSINIVKNELLKNFYIKELKNNKNAPNELLFITSLVLANSLNKWFDKLIKKHNLYSLELKKENGSFFETHNKITDEKSFFESQAILTKLIVRELKSSNEFHDFINQNCMKAQMIYEKHTANHN